MTERKLEEMFRELDNFAQLSLHPTMDTSLWYATVKRARATLREIARAEHPCVYGIGEPNCPCAEHRILRAILAALEEK